MPDKVRRTVRNWFEYRSVFPNRPDESRKTFFRVEESRDVYLTTTYVLEFCGCGKSEDNFDDKCGGKYCGRTRIYDSLFADECEELKNVLLEMGLLGVIYDY
eukprot:GHVP01031752.1.p1 GENE.GHVP01031752.1~~GHVP01031752.1.p1  ORF type:complete len:102 (+),score=10.21 GHVP01031752.1:177-482(+)